MNGWFIIIILFSFLVSTLTCMSIEKRKGRKCSGMLGALCVNAFLLSTATILLYKIDVQSFHKQTEGVFGSLGILVLICFIPVITLLTYYFMEIKRSMLKGDKSE